MKKRIFLGVPLPGEIKKQLKEQLPDIPGKAVPIENWHFTLQFLGDLEETELEKLNYILHSLELGESFMVSLEGLGAFPRVPSAKVLWIGVNDGAKEFIKLADTLSLVLANEGFKVDIRSYVPHLTLSRFFPPRNVSKWINLTLSKLSFQVNEIVVYESILGKGPAQYKPLATFPLHY